MKIAKGNANEIIKSFSHFIPEYSFRVSGLFTFAFRRFFVFYLHQQIIPIMDGHRTVEHFLSDTAREREHENVL